MGTDPGFFISSLCAFSACILVDGLFIYLIISATHAPKKGLVGGGLETSDYVRRTCIWFIILIMSILSGIGVDWVNESFHLKYNAGQYLRFVTAFSVGICGIGMFYNIYLILNKYKRDL